MNGRAMRRIGLVVVGAMGCLACDVRASGQAEAAQVAPGTKPKEVDRMLGQVSSARLMADVEALAAFGTRHTLSETESETRGVGAARRWVAAQFRAAGEDSGRSGDRSLLVLMDAHVVEPDGRRIPTQTTITNVVCEIPGSMPEAAHRRYYMLAHLDSRATDVMDAQIDAPGANDDASGVAALIELARVMSKHDYDATIVLMATTGEEQGLIGARRHAQAAAARGDTICAVLNNDMIGDPYGDHAANSEPGKRARGLVRVFAQGVSPTASEHEVAEISRLGAENDSPHRALARYAAEVAEIHALPVRPWIIYRNDRFLRGGDHTPFVEEGWAAVRFTVPHESYPRQHEDVRMEGGVQYGDLVEFVDAAYLAEVTQLNGAVLAHLANAPSAPANARIIVAGLTNDTTLRWGASPEPDVTGYEIVWRDTASPAWQHVRDVGDVTEATIELSKDNWLFGVRAYDRRGYRSPVSFPAAARE